ncbi:putative alpha beta hydrolase superfamily protein [Phaeomoniella chlamydospora]|uniref:Putative alpha beta hydrolase superfamily protein n=1 Tax=Phaeomoniella chlamydospora TaxID=158046 RepID=A0A0G2H1M7_PHACM|nr:putative alpha beta hydrolase superfamily protein [Phaeomoniella chlamydospora]
MTVEIIDTDGGKLAVEVEGDGPLIVCSPGLGDTRDAYAPLAEELVASGYRVARIDLRGHGDSTAHFDRYGDEAIADDFLTVIEALGGGPAVLAGASMSAAAAVIAAGRHPDRIAGIVLLGPFLRNGVGYILRWVFHLAFYRPWGPYIWQYYAATLWPGLGDKAKERAAKSTASVTRPGRWEAFHTMSGTDHSVVAPWIGRVQAPVLVVIGDADPDWKDPLEEAKWVASNFTDVETVTVHGAGHAPMFERPDIVGPSFSGFLDKIRAGKTFKLSNH